MRSYHHPQVLTAGPGPKRSTPYSLEPGGGPSHSEMVPADVVYFGIRRWEDFLHFPGGSDETVTVSRPPAAWGQACHQLLHT